MDDLEKWLQISLNACNLVVNLVNRLWPRKPDDKPEKPAPQPRKKPHSGNGKRRKR